jgi:hypothetical protein
VEELTATRCRKGKLVEAAGVEDDPQALVID